MTQRPYSEEFKREAVELLRTSGRPSAQIARELGVSAESLRLWRKQAESDDAEHEEPSSNGEEPQRRRLTKRTRVWGSLAVVLLAGAAAIAFLLLPLAGCGGDDDGPVAGTAEKGGQAAKPVAGSFVGEVSGTEAFVALVAEPAGADPQNRREVQIYLADGEGLNEWFVGSISNNRFTAKSDDGDAQAKGRLSEDSVAGTVELPDGETARYSANPPGGAAGLYDLSYSRKGKLTGASAGGLGLSGTIKLPEGTGTLRLADGRRLKFTLTEDPAADLARLGAGQVLLIVLPDGQLRGAGKSRPSADNGDSSFLISG